MYNPEIPVEDTPWGRIILERAETVLRHCIAQAKYMEHYCLEHDAAAYRSVFAEDVLILRELLRLCTEEGWNRLRTALFTLKFPNLPGSNRVPANDRMITEEVKAARDAYKKPVYGNDAELRRLFDASAEDFREDIADLYPKVRRLFDLVMDYDRVFSEKKTRTQGCGFPRYGAVCPCGACGA